MANYNVKHIQIGSDILNIGFSTHDLTDELYNYLTSLSTDYPSTTLAEVVRKLGTIAEGAQVNVIETIKLNGTNLSVTNKTVDLGELQKKLIPGVGIALDAQGNISCTLDTTIYVLYPNGLPAAPEPGNEQKIHIVPSDAPGEGNTKIEYLYIDGAWEKIGEFKANIDLSNYVTKAELETVDTKASNAQTTANEAKSQADTNKTAIGTENDSASDTGSLHARIKKNSADITTIEERIEELGGLVDKHTTFSVDTDTETLIITTVG